DRGSAATGPVPAIAVPSAPPADGRYESGRTCLPSPRCGQNGGLLSALRSLASVAVAEDDVLLRGESFQPDRATRMQLVGGNADLCTKPVFEAIGKTCRGVDHHRAGIHLAQEALR